MSCGDLTGAMAKRKYQTRCGFKAPPQKDGLVRDVQGALAHVKGERWGGYGRSRNRGKG